MKISNLFHIAAQNAVHEGTWANENSSTAALASPSATPTGLRSSSSHRLPDNGPPAGLRAVAF
jgi:hypothetical protein